MLTSTKILTCLVALAFVGTGHHCVLGVSFAMRNELTRKQIHDRLIFASHEDDINPTPQTVENYGLRTTDVSNLESMSIGGSDFSGGERVIESNYVSGGGINSTGGGDSTTVVEADSIPRPVEYNTHIFYFSAPEEEENEERVNQQLSNVLKNNLQVVFIKSPKNTASTNVALQLTKQANEQNTAIYSLSNENDASQVVGQLQQIQNVPTVPTVSEVRIIQNHTQKDFIYTQATSQNQYDNFGGIGGGVEGLSYYHMVSPITNTKDIEGIS